MSPSPNLVSDLNNSLFWELLDSQTVDDKRHSFLSTITQLRVCKAQKWTARATKTDSDRYDKRFFDFHEQFKYQKNHVGVSIIRKS